MEQQIHLVGLPFDKGAPCRGYRLALQAVRDRAFPKSLTHLDHTPIKHGDGVGRLITGGDYSMALANICSVFPDSPSERGSVT